MTQHVQHIGGAHKVERVGTILSAHDFSEIEPKSLYESANKSSSDPFVGRFTKKKNFSNSIEVFQKAKFKIAPLETFKSFEKSVDLTI